MGENFQETLNLKERLENMQRQKQQQEMAQRQKQEAMQRQKQQQDLSVRKKQERSRDLDRLFSDGSSEEEQQKKMQKISRPQTQKREMFKYFGPILVVAVLFFVAFYFYKNGGNQKNQDNISGRQAEWCAVKLINGEVYYGQIENKEADPVIIRNVYYNYDQLKTGNEKGEDGKTSGLRLVKRGNETYGPSGTMDVVRAQIVYMESLKSDSKVLRAILDYEK